MHLCSSLSYIIQVFWLISKAIIQNGKENMILETPYKALVNI